MPRHNPDEIMELAKGNSGNVNSEPRRSRDVSEFDAEWSGGVAAPETLSRAAAEQMRQQMARILAKHSR